MFIPKLLPRVGLALTLVMSLAAKAEDNSKRSDIEAALKLKKLQSKGLEDANARKVVASMVDFGLVLQRAHRDASKDVTTSPFSVVSAFGLVLNGASDGRGLTELQQALALKGVSREQFNSGYEALRRSLADISKDNVLTYGNALFVDPTFPIRDEYVKTIRDSLGAEARSVNFQKEEAAAAEINGYVSEKTETLIPKIVTPDQVKGWVTALINAGYFKGAWEFKFDVKDTKEDAHFETAKGRKVVPLMHQRNKYYLYHRGDGFQMASLAYKNADFAMDLIVPDRRQGESVTDALKRVEDQLTGENYRSWVANSRAQEIVLGLPRFETEYMQDMSDYFKRAMPIAFSDRAQFGLFSTEGMKLDKVIHGTVLKVNEEGTEGAFATVIGGVRTTSVPPPPPQVIADRPFLMVIRHTASGTPIFVSSIQDPKPMARR